MYQKTSLEPYGYDGYSIDTDGQVWSESRKVKQGNRSYSVKGKMLKKVPSPPHGYNRVWLYVNGTMYQPYVMVLMGLAFLNLDRDSDLNEVNHISCDRSDDSLTNVELMTRKQNVQHSYDVCRPKARRENAT